MHLMERKVFQCKHVCSSTWNSPFVMLNNETWILFFVYCNQGSVLLIGFTRTTCSWVCEGLIYLAVNSIGMIWKEDFSLQTWPVTSILAIHNPFSFQFHRNRRTTSVTIKKASETLKFRCLFWNLNGHWSMSQFVTVSNEYAHFELNI